ncbi:OmpA family protein [Ferrimonas marina]|uniref:Outer membrane protein OmpA n=1 Tax=Ferrimonas marina TaxID=299255 RepID=A0A1M5XV36_9GAMM|nr:OmpA family protein [Ferrimonas marina]SHI03667.1 Outer membrane protein OmpA [Ferrimonas marina]
MNKPTATPLAFLCAGLILSGCANQPLVQWQSTEQQYDLSDADGDGVILAREACPESLGGAEVSNDGCDERLAYTARRELKVLFENNSSRLDTEVMDSLHALADFMAQYPETKVIIEGHCSEVGSHSYNQWLSERRAESVKTALMEHFGLQAQRIDTVGYSFDRPEDPGNDPLAHSRNRRVVAEISSEDEKVAMKWTVWTVGR